MVQINPKFIGCAEAHFVIAELNGNVLSYKLYDAEQNEFACGSLATDGTITNETALENVLSSLGAQLLENGTE